MAAKRISGTKLEIVQAATRMFLEKGYSKTSIKAISDEVNISAGNLTFHFPTKEHLLAVLVEMLCEFQWDIIDLNAQYITCHPKCTAGSPVEEYASYCESYLIHEIIKINPNKIIFFGVDIPEKVIRDLAHIYKIYKFNDLYTIKHGSRTVQQFRNKLKYIL